jgi:anti-sigma factor RsiW
MDEDTPLEFELHGYVDGVIDDEAAARVERYLRRNAAVAEKVRDYLEQRNHIRSFAQSAITAPPSPTLEKLEKQLGRRIKRNAIFRWRRAAVMALIFSAGWVGHTVYAPIASGPGFTDEIVRAHILTSADPAEVIPISPDRVRKLFERIGEAEYLPDLQSVGFQPIGAQLVPSDEGIVLHVPYRDDRGTIVSYFVLHDDNDASTPRHVVHRQGVTMIYWQHEHSRYAVAAALTDDQVNDFANFLQPAQAAPVDASDVRWD